MYVYAEEQLSADVWLWRIYESADSLAQRKSYIGAFVVQRTLKGVVGKGLVLQKPFEFRITELRRLAEKLAERLQVDCITLERHGRWIKVRLLDLWISDEQVGANSGIDTGRPS